MFRKLNLGHFYLHHINLSGLIHKGCKIQVYLAPTELSISLFLFLPANKQEDKGKQIQERKNFLKISSLQKWGEHWKELPREVWRCWMWHSVLWVGDKEGISLESMSWRAFPTAVIIIPQTLTGSSCHHPSQLHQPQPASTAILSTEQPQLLPPAAPEPRCSASWELLLLWLLCLIAAVSTGRKRISSPAG